MGDIVDTSFEEPGRGADGGGQPAISSSAAWLREHLQGKWALLHLLPVAGRGRATALIVVLVFDAVTPVLFSVATGIAVGSVPGVARAGLSSPAGRHLGLWLLLLSIALVLQRVSGPIRSAITNAFARAVDLRLRERVMDAALAPTGVAHLEDPQILDLIELSRGVSVWGASPGQAVAGLSMILSVRFTGVIALVILGRFKWWLPFVLGAVAWVVVRTKYRLYLQMSTHVTSKAEELRRSRYFRDLVLSPEAAKEMRVFGLSGWMRGRFNTAWLAAMVEVWRARGRGAPLVFISMLARFGAALFTVTLIARAGVTHQISLAAVIVFAQAVDNSAVLSYTLGNPELFVQQGLTGTAAAFELEQRLPALARTGARSADHLPANTIRFEGVRFRYRGRDRDVFESLDLEIMAGRSLAIVGENGAGKTTIVKLLTRLYQPDAGRITVDGVDLADFDPASWHRRVAAIFQDFVRFPLSAAENVAWGAVHLEPDDATLAEVAADAGIADVVAALDHGWATILSRQYQGGADLSGGEWQRVALARALYAVRGGAGVLVLDEPTAHLDVRAEAHLYDRFLELTRGITSVIISHRFSTVRRADRIVVVDRGRVTEHGTHDELIALAGHYATMFSLQAARFTGTADDGDEN